MVYGKSYKILINLREYDDEVNFEGELQELCNKHKAILMED